MADGNGRQQPASASYSLSVPGYWRGAGPKGRAGLKGVASDHCCYLFGGHLGENVCTADIIIHDFSTQQWRWVPTQQVTANTPRGRDGHSAVLYDDSMWVFGGQSSGEDGDYLADMFRLDLHTLEWTRVVALDAAEAPSPRRGHSAVVVGSSMYVFAGQTANDKFNDLFRFNFADLAWTNLTRTPRPAGWPSPRGGHSCVAAEDSLIVFGGCGQNTERYQDLYIYTISTATWRAVPQVGRIPCGRSEHAAVMMPQGMLVHGGWMQERNCSTTHLLNLTTFCWSKVDAAEWPAPDLADHTAVVYAGNCYLFGGYRDLEQPVDGMLVHQLRFRDEASSENLAVTPIPSQLSTKYAQLVGREQYADIKLQAADGVEIPAHRVILSVRSDYFRALLDGEMRDSHQPVLDLKSLSEPVLRTVLGYIYAATTDVPNELLVDTHAAADMLLLEELKTACERRLMRGVSASNCCHLLQVADRHTSVALRARCLSLMVQEYEVVVNTVEYESLLNKHPELVLEVQRALLHRLRSSGNTSSRTNTRKRKEPGSL